jgi:hypothetical protein
MLAVIVLFGRFTALAGDAVAQSVQLALEYDPQPPYQAGSPATAPPAITDARRARRGSILT